MPYKREQKTNKKLKVKEEREIKKKHLSSDQEQGEICLRCWCCLLYTSDAADELMRV